MYECPVKDCDGSGENPQKLYYHVMGKYNKNLQTHEQAHNKQLMGAVSEWQHQDDPEDPPLSHHIDTRREDLNLEEPDVEEPGTLSIPPSDASEAEEQDEETPEMTEGDTCPLCGEGQMMDAQKFVDELQMKARESNSMEEADMAQSILEKYAQDEAFLEADEALTCNQPTCFSWREI